MLECREEKLVYHFDAEELWIEPWGPNALRIRATKEYKMPSGDWALAEKPGAAAKAPSADKGPPGEMTCSVRILPQRYAGCKQGNASCRKTLSGVGNPGLSGEHTTGEHPPQTNAPRKSADISI